MKRRTRTEYQTLQIVGHSIPVKIHHEVRRNARFSFGKEHVIFRLPRSLSSRQRVEYMDWFHTTLEKKIQKSPELAERYRRKEYEDGSVLKVGEREYQLRITYVDRATHKAQLHGNVIAIELSNHHPEDVTQKSLRTLLSRIIAKDFHPHITRRVAELNQQYFQKPIQQVKLKYTSSRWGSCSSSGNINLSTRLLFAPEEVIDYVIIHELAHLIEANHSHRFWKLVEDAMPEYREHEKWLKENGHRFDF